MRGAGGTDGGAGRFILGAIMFVGGGLPVSRKYPSSLRFQLGYGALQHGGMGVTSGMLLIPFMLGVGMIFYSGRNPLGWLLAVGAVVAMGFGVLSNVRLELAHMSLFNLLTILVLNVGGAGLLLSSLRSEKPALRGPRGRDRLRD
jgi:hypothetical protein